MLKQIITPIAALAIFMASGVTQVEAKRVKESAELFISFELLPNTVQPAASGTAEIELTRDNGEEETTFDFEVNGLSEGSYRVNAETAEGAVEITEFVVEPTVVVPPVEGEPTPEVPAEEEAEIELPGDLNPLDILAITVVKVDVAPAVEGTPETEVLTEVLRGEADSSATYWMFNANVKVTGPTTPIVDEDPTVEPTEPTKGNGKPKKPKKVKGPKGPKVKAVHGHVVVHALIIGDVEKKRKFLFNAQGAPANTVLTLNVDGVPVETFTSSHNGKVMIKSLDESIRVAGIREITITDADDVVIMEAHF
jgi:hypothetical protein